MFAKLKTFVSDRHRRRRGLKQAQIAIRQSKVDRLPEMDDSECDEVALILSAHCDELQARWRFRFA